MIKIDNDSVYEVVVEDCIDGDRTTRTELFRTFEDAQEYMNNKIEIFEIESPNLPLQDKGENFVSYYKDGWYNDNHYDITIFEKEIN